MPRSLPKMERACPRSGLRSRPSWTHTGAWAWNLLRLPVSLKPCGACHRQVGVSQKQARPLDADALAAIRATALTSANSRVGGSLEMEDTALRRSRHGHRPSICDCPTRACVSRRPPILRWRDVLDAENDAGLVYIERSKD